MSGSQGPWSYAVTGSGITATASRASAIGFRRSRPSGPLENDGFNRLGGSARVGYDAGEGVRFDAGVLSSFTRANYDEPPARFPTRRRAPTSFTAGLGDAAAVDTFDGRWTHSLNVFADRIDRSFHDVTFGPTCCRRTRRLSCRDFIGDRAGAEYQGNSDAGRSAR